jgi:TATA-box binding protein (TBP) (component of TFIID and TFIIIB)
MKCDFCKKEFIDSGKNIHLAYATGKTVCSDSKCQDDSIIEDSKIVDAMKSTTWRS